MNNNQDTSGSTGSPFQPSREKSRDNKEKSKANDQIAKEIRGIIAKIAKLPIEKIVEDANLFTDLGIESLAGVEIFAELDKKYNLNVPEEAVKDVATVNDLVVLVQRLLSKQ